MNKVLVLYPNQLFATDLLPKDIDKIVLVEEPLLFGTDKQYPSYFHKQKLVLHRASMRRYAKEMLWPAGYQVEYVEFSRIDTSENIVEWLQDAEQVVIFDVVDDILRRRLSGALANIHKPLLWLETPGFYLKREELKVYFSGKTIPDFVDFYRWQRERWNVMLTANYKPSGGKLMHEDESVSRIPDGEQLPSFAVFGDNDYVREACDYMHKHFPDNYGSLEDFPWPTSHDEASRWLQDFVESRLEKYGIYSEALEPGAPWLYHAAISATLNIGLLKPQQIIEVALAQHEKKKLPLTSLEPFIREVLGWREFHRGIYESMQVNLRSKNAFDNQRRLTEDWFAGTTGLPPLDDVIRKVHTRAYAHHAERSDILGAAMLVCEIQPREVYQWCNEMYIDAYDWCSVPIVYGYSQCVDGGKLAGVLPMVTSSNILSRGHFEGGDWCDVWDGLYWRFVNVHKQTLDKNPNMRLIVRAGERLSEDRKRIIGYRAEDFLNSKTAKG